MTKRPQKARDYDEFPLNEHEKQTMLQTIRRMKRQAERLERRLAFNKKARENNRIHGIKPRV